MGLLTGSGNRQAMIDRLVLATDGSASIERATAVAIDLAERFEATIHALYVIDEDDLDAAPADVREGLRSGLEDRSTGALGMIRDEADTAVAAEVRTGRPGVEIVSYAEEVDADIVAIGTRGRHGEHRLLLGSVAEEVVRRCPIPVLTVRQLANGSSAT